MNDREEVIKGLCEAARLIDNYVPVRYIGYEHKACMKAVELLKEQEPVLLENQHKPYGINTNANSPWISRCPKCGKKVEGRQTRFCKYCGKAVKWDE